jgi:hypothetical protein
LGGEPQRHDEHKEQGEQDGLLPVERSSTWA